MLPVSESLSAADMDTNHTLAGQASRVELEIAALRRLVNRNVVGDPICYAFGFDTDELSPTFSQRRFLFEICNETGLLVLTIDAYCANSPEFIDAPDFDVDQWEAEKIRLYAPASRICFRAMSQVARAVIKGRTVKIVGGTVSLDGFISDSAEGC